MINPVGAAEKAWVEVPDEVLEEEEFDRPLAGSASRLFTPGRHQVSLMHLALAVNGEAAPEY